MNPILKILVNKLIKNSELKPGEIVAFTKLDGKVKAAILKDGQELRHSINESSKNIEALFKSFKTDYFTMEITDKNLIIEPKGQNKIIL